MESDVYVHCIYLDGGGGGGSGGRWSVVCVCLGSFRPFSDLNDPNRPLNSEEGGLLGNSRQRGPTAAARPQRPVNAWRVRCQKFQPQQQQHSAFFW